ncbi:MAG: hypothetical protein ACE5HU_04705 [Acidobacteriota bacterium]
MRTDRIESLARDLAARDRDRITARRRAADRAQALHDVTVTAIGRFAEAVRRGGAGHLDLLRVDPVEPDDKSVRAFQFAVRRGRFQALVICKDRDEVMLVGPFKRGRTEEPCRTLHLAGDGDHTTAVEQALEQLQVDLIRESFAK